jgi:hypothetical protein
LLYKLLLSSKHTIMSSFYEDASLVMIPSGYKTSKVYSAKPTDGAGDLTFTRSNDTATRVNSAGLIEKVRTNLILQSNSFSDAAWVKLGVGTGTAPVLTANYTTDPFGGNNAWRLQCDLNGGTASGDRSWIYQTFAGSPSNGTLSIYVKLNSAGSVNLVFSDGAGDTQTVTSTTWVRLNIPSAAIGEFRLGLIGYNGTDTCDLSIAFSQVEAGDIATDYIATTTAAVSVGPVANVPRLDYLGSSCPRLLLEPQRTNSAQFSEQTDNAFWLKYQCSITANQAVSPDGYQNADLLTSTVSGISVIYKAGIAAGALSFFAKAVTLSAGAEFYVSVDGVGGATWNQDGTLASVAGGTATNGVSYGNGWFRFDYNVTSGSVINYGLSGSTSGDTAYVWGIQNEASASYPTSYIPTLGASVTRGADAASKTGISSLIGQTEGTLFVEFEYQPTSVSQSIAISDGTSTNRIDIRLSTSNQLAAVVVSGGVVQVSMAAAGTMTQGQRVKAAFAYKNNDFALYQNGVLVVSAAAGTVAGTISRYGFDLNGAQFLNSPVNQALLFKTRLSNSSLAELTA